VRDNSFVHIVFDHAHTTRSNLGGQGGRCNLGGLPDGCDEPAVSDPPPAGTVPHEVYIRDIGRDVLGSNYGGAGWDASSAGYVDMRITNVTEYRAWRTVWNGLKRAGGSDESSFAVVNLLGPREPSQTGYIWNSEMTFVELKVEFKRRSQAWNVNGDVQAQMDAATDYTIPVTYFTFYDFDTGLPRFDSALASPEAMQMDPVRTWEILPEETELERLDTWNQALAQSQIDSFFPSSADQAYLNSWGTKITKASRYGIGRDNPLNSFTLTPLQQNRSIMFEISNVQSFHVRYAITICCTTGRNFMWAGYSESILPICPDPPSPPRAWT